MPTAGTPAGPPARATRREGVLAIDAIQQRLFAVALGLRSLRTTASDGDVEAELVRLEGEIDSAIKDVRAHDPGRGARGTAARALQGDGPARRAVRGAPDRSARGELDPAGAAGLRADRSGSVEPADRRAAASHRADDQELQLTVLAKLGMERRSEAAILSARLSERRAQQQARAGTTHPSPFSQRPAG
jgi:hypothetical protein